jgi:pyruvate/2-oxoglutarate dehydrogenase complex dihydrolipoamide acyltransferase (E2) component
VKTTYTTHLICAPHLQDIAVVSEYHVYAGQKVEADQVLVVLQSPNGALEVSAPEAGLIGQLLSAEHEQVQPGELLLTMEIEEKPFGFMGLEEEPEFAPACQLAYAAPAPALVAKALHVEPAAARLAGMLALDLSEVRPGPDGEVDEEAVAAHVRDILIRWRKVKRLLSEAG